jgi:serine/threonine protein kinase
MSIIISNKYEILEKLGEGTFGKVFEGINIRSGEKIAIKIQHKDIENVLKHEAKLYKYLKDISGIPNIRNYGMESGFNYLILDLLGSSLYDIEMNLEKTIKYMQKSLNIIEKIHDKGIIHRDIKPDNFLLDKLDGKNIYLIDFGLSKYYFDMNKNHMEERKDRHLIGTAKFSSLNVHNGIEASRRDDLESICYTFISLCGKKLPWEEIINQYKSSNDTSNKLQLYNEVKKIKEKSLEWLYDIPGEFITILLYCRKLKFDEKPNYNYIQGLLNNLLQLL